MLKMNLIGYFLLTLWITIASSQIITTSTSSSALIQIVQQLANQTNALEARLNQEFRTQLTLLQEVQSKNDQVQFLHRDIAALNQTLQKERGEKDVLEKRLENLENKLITLEATSRECKESQNGIDARLQTLESMVDKQLPKVNEEIRDLNQTFDSLLASISELETLNVSAIQADHAKIGILEKELMTLNTIHMQLFTNLTKDIILSNAYVQNATRNINNLEIKLENMNVSLVSSIAAAEMKIHHAVEASVNNTLHKEAAILLQKLQNVNISLSRQIDNDRNRVSVAENTIKSLSSGIQNQNGELLAVNTRIHNLQMNLTDLKALTSSKAQPVLFSVSRPGETIVQHPRFTNIIYNVGGAFDPTTSLFVAPVSGRYMFTATIQKSTQGDRIMCWIRLNGNLLVNVNAHAAFPGTEASGSNTVLVLMTKGDRLELNECQGNSKFSQNGSSFSGALLSQV